MRNRNQTLGETVLTPERFAGLLILLDQERIKPARPGKLLIRMLDKKGRPEEIMAAEVLQQVSDAAELENLVDTVLADHPADVADFQKGNAKGFRVLMGLAMKCIPGKANPNRLRSFCPMG